MTIAFGIQMVRLAILVQMNRRTIPRLSIVIPTHQHLTQIATPVHHRWAVQIRHQAATAQVQAAVQIRHQAAIVQVQAAVRRQVHRQVAVQAQILILNQNVIAVMI